MKRHLKKMKTDKSAENFLKKDLSLYIHPENFQLMRFELKPKKSNSNNQDVRRIIKALKTKAKKQGIHYQKLMRQALEKEL